MNYFNLHTVKNDQGKVIGPNNVHIHLSEFSEDGVLGAQMRAAFEIEMLQGRKEADAQGGTHYYFELSDEKMAMLRQWLMLLFFQPSVQ